MRGKGSCLRPQGPPPLQNLPHFPQGASTASTASSGKRPSFGKGLGKFRRSPVHLLDEELGGIDEEEAFDNLEADDLGEIFDEGLQGRRGA